MVWIVLLVAITSLRSQEIVALYFEVSIREAAAAAVAGELLCLPLLSFFYPVFLLHLPGWSAGWLAGNFAQIVKLQ